MIKNTLYLYVSVLILFLVHQFKSYIRLDSHLIAAVWIDMILPTPTSHPLNIKSRHHSQKPLMSLRPRSSKHFWLSPPWWHSWRGGSCSPCCGSFWWPLPGGSRCPRSWSCESLTFECRGGQNWWLPLRQCQMTRSYLERPWRIKELSKRWTKSFYLDRIPCVAIAYTMLAPFSFKTFAALT